jgi:hypothetical protein
MVRTIVHGTRRKHQNMLSPSADFPMHKANSIINSLVNRVLNLEPDAKVRYKFFRGEPRIAKAEITHAYFKVRIWYDPPYGMVHGAIASTPPAEITSELTVEASYDAEKAKTLAEIVKNI